MNDFPNPSTIQSASVVTDSAHECRRSRRSKIGLSLRARPSDPERDEHFEEVRPTLNAARDGLYFASWRESYYEGMRVFVTFPYSSHPDAIGCEYLGHVVRVDRLADGRLGVAVQLLMTANLKPSCTPASMVRK